MAARRWASGSQVIRVWKGSGGVSQARPCRVVDRHRGLGRPLRGQGGAAQVGRRRPPPPPRVIANTAWGRLTAHIMAARTFSAPRSAREGCHASAVWAQPLLVDPRQAVRHAPPRSSVPPCPRPTSILISAAHVSRTCCGSLAPPRPPFTHPLSPPPYPPPPTPFPSSPVSRLTPRTSAPAVAQCRDISLYEKMNRIEEGTYGVVYKARNLQTGQVCALKRLKMERENNGFPVTSVREINILLKLQHPNIVKVHEVVMGKPGSGDNDIFMVMEYIENDLRKLMTSKKSTPRSFSTAEVKCLMLQLLSGVAYLHDNWVLHRDLKTSNILYSNRGELKICDLGLARHYGSPLRPYTQPVVTLWYRAPELLLGIRRYSTPIDMWSPLFPGQSELAQLNEIISVLGTPTVEAWPGLTALPHYGKSQFRVLPSTLRSRFTSAFGGSAATLTEAGLDLMQAMLAYDPERRLTAHEALEHRWFKESPLPQKQALMPQFATLKEGGKATRHAAAAGAGLLASPM
ncbi:MAG: hypothetical protein WDW36_009937 [Sanguina aurantia]